ncbi:MAG: hypothetical protein QM699_11955 [Amaricoccus sp.]|uniref:hypothetical protein n=1 Tax=Amaricoccus sp. TaxID=1872485 RepID=UPI0039E2ACB3
MNKDRFDALSPDEQAALKQAVVETTAWYRDQLDSVYAQVTAELKGKGVTVTTVDPAPFRAMVDPVYAKFGAEWGEDYVAEVRKAAAGE